MTKASVVFKLDNSDQIMVDGKILSRIIIDGYLVGKQPVTEFPVTLPNRRQQYWAMAKPVGSKGGYIDSLDNISNNVAIDGSHAWIDSDSIVYDSKIGPYITIKNSKVSDSTITSAGVCHSFTGSPYDEDADPIYQYGLIQNSAIVSSELYNVTTENSVVRHSTINRMAVFESTIVESIINPKKLQRIFNSTIMHTASQLNESFSHINVNHVTIGNKLMELNHSYDRELDYIDDKGIIINTDAIDDLTNTPIICVIYNNVMDYKGDAKTDWSTVYDYLQQSDYQWSKNAKNKVRKLVKMTNLS